MAGPPKKRQKRDEKQDGEMPQKKYYRQRAHANPFSDHDLTYPESPAAMDWSLYYPAYIQESSENNPLNDSPSNGTSTVRQISKQVEVADIGCGFGGLLFALAPRMPQTLLLGLEIRTAVTEYVQEKIKAMRSQAQLARSTAAAAASSSVITDTDVDTGREMATYDNISCIRANTMKFLPNFFRKAQLGKIFLCFPDPHFKARKHKARIVNASLNSEYAFVVRPGGKIYTITDVEDLHAWMVEHFVSHPSFERVEEGEVEGDECAQVMKTETEEGKKVDRNGGTKFVAVFRRLEDPAWP